MTLDGPFSILDVDAFGEPIPGQLAAGVHYQTDARTLAAHEALLTPYRVHPARLQNVYAGDDPAAPVQTIPLRFPDEETAEAVKAELGAA